MRPMSVDKNFDESFDELKKLDTWTSQDYQNYYLKLLPFFKEWYNVKEGYRPVVMGRNIVWWLENGEVRRKCNRKTCKLVDNSKEDCTHKILDSFHNSKIGHWICELDRNRIVENKKNKTIKSLSSGWIRYFDIHQKILWNINMIEEHVGVLKTIRCMYWQPAIRDYKLVNLGTDKSWNEIVAENFVIDIDVVDKNRRSIFENDIWSNVDSMIIDADKLLKEEDIDYKLMFSGNGIYFITKRIVAKDEMYENENLEQFWNIISAGWNDWINKVFKVKIEEKYGKFFSVDGDAPYTMKFYKTPFSLHQTFDVSAIPINIDLIHNITCDEFKNLCEPKFVVNNYEYLLNKAWG